MEDISVKWNSLKGAFNAAPAAQTNIASVSEYKLDDQVC